MKTLKGIVAVLFVVASLSIGTAAVAGPVGGGGSYWDCETQSFIK